MLFEPTSGVIMMLLEKLKYTGSGMNSKKWHEVMRRYQWNVEDEDECFLIRFVHVRCFDQKEIRRFVDT